MAVSRTTLYSEAINSGDPWTTVGSFTLTNGDLLTISVSVQCFGGGTLPTALSFDKGVWDVVTHVDDVASLHGIWMYRGVGNAASGVITVSQTGGANLKSANITCEDWTGADTSGTNGSNGIAQSVGIGPSASANPQVISGSLGAAPAASSATYFAQSSGSLSTPDAAFAEIVDQTGTDYFMESQWVTPAVQSVSATGATAFQPQVGIAVEIKADAGGGGGVAPVTPVPVPSRRMASWVRRTM